jgi:hypothetical protein
MLFWLMFSAPALAQPPDLGLRVLRRAAEARTQLKLSAANLSKLKRRWAISSRGLATAAGVALAMMQKAAARSGFRRAQKQRGAKPRLATPQYYYLGITCPFCLSELPSPERRQQLLELLSRQVWLLVSSVPWFLPLAFQY